MSWAWARAARPRDEGYCAGNSVGWALRPSIVSSTARAAWTLGAPPSGSAMSRSSRDSASNCARRASPSRTRSASAAPWAAGVHSRCRNSGIARSPRMRLGSRERFTAFYGGTCIFPLFARRRRPKALAGRGGDRSWMAWRRLLREGNLNSRTTPQGVFRRPSNDGLLGRRGRRCDIARPAQRRHRIAARVGLDQRVQILEQTGVRFRQRFASSSRTANATEPQRPRRVEFLQAASDRARGDARDAGNRSYAAMPRRPGFRRSKKPSLPFIQLRQYRCIALPQLLERIFINHPQNYDAPRPPGIPATSLSARNQFSYWLTGP